MIGAGMFSCCYFEDQVAFCVAMAIVAGKKLLCVLFCVILCANFVLRVLGKISWN